MRVLSMGMFDNLEQLETLSLRRNQLKAIEEHGTFTIRHRTLRRLDLSENKLDRLGQFTFKYLASLTELDLSHNLLQGGEDSLPVASLFIEKSSLERLNISHNYLKVVEFALLFKQEKLTHLDLGFNNITKIGQNGESPVSPWKELRNLKQLYVHYYSHYYYYQTRL